MIAALSALATWLLQIFNAQGSGLMARVAKYALFSIYISIVWVGVNKIMSFLPLVDLGLPPCAAHFWNLLGLSEAIASTVAIVVIGFVTKSAIAYWRNL